MWPYHKCNCMKNENHNNRVKTRELVFTPGSKDQIRSQVNDFICSNAEAELSLLQKEKMVLEIFNTINEQIDKHSAIDEIELTLNWKPSAGAQLGGSEEIEIRRIKAPPGNLTYRILSFLMPHKERQKVIDPWRADYVHELNEALDAGNKWRSRWMSILYHLLLVPVMAKYVADWMKHIIIPSKETADAE